MLAVCLAGLACRSPSGRPGPSISFGQVPPAAAGGSRDVATIAGRVTGAAPGQRIVLFARTEGWWVQPLSTSPYTGIGTDATWKNSTHLGCMGVAMAGSAPAAPYWVAAPPTAWFVGAVAVALALLGPGAFSIDARLFGRREVVISAARTVR